MDKPNRSTDCARPSLSLDAVLVQVSTIAVAIARQRCQRDIAEDIAQDIVLSFVERLGAGRLTEPSTHLDALITRMVRQRLIDRERRNTIRAQREADYVDAIADRRHVWMNPDDAVEQAELAALHTSILDTLPKRQRSALVLVREDAVTYKVAGETLGLTPLAICKHVVSAQQTFRERLSRAGVTVTMQQPPRDRSRSSAHRHAP